MPSVFQTQDEIFLALIILSHTLTLLILTFNFHVFQVCFATCFDPNILANLQANKGKLLRVKPTSADVVYR